MASLPLAGPMIIAHRGYSARYPENTHAAFAAAIDSGADMIELDAAFTRDREVAVIHDETVDRTTDGKGRVCDMTLNELRALNAGSWFDPGFTKERVPSLEEVVSRYSRKIFLNIEIKMTAFMDRQTPRALAARVVEIVQAAGARRRVLLSSFSRRTITEVKRLAPDIALAYLSRSAADRNALAFCIRLGLYSWHPSLRKISRERISPFTAAGLKVFPYTLNTRKEMERVIGMGANGIITNDPALAVKVIKRPAHGRRSEGSGPPAAGF